MKLISILSFPRHDDQVQRNVVEAHDTQAKTQRFVIAVRGKNAFQNTHTSIVKEATFSTRRGIAMLLVLKIYAKCKILSTLKGNAFYDRASAQRLLLCQSLSLRREPSVRAFNFPLRILLPSNFQHPNSHRKCSQRNNAQTHRER